MLKKQSDRRFLYCLYSHRRSFSISKFCADAAEGLRKNENQLREVMRFSTGNQHDNSDEMSRLKDSISKKDALIDALRYELEQWKDHRKVSTEMSMVKDINTPRTSLNQVAKSCNEEDLGDQANDSLSLKGINERYTSRNRESTFAMLGSCLGSTELWEAFYENQTTIFSDIDEAACKGQLMQFFHSNSFRRSLEKVAVSLGECSFLSTGRKGNAFSARPFDLEECRLQCIRPVDEMYYKGGNRISTTRQQGNQRIALWDCKESCWVPNGLSVFPEGEEPKFADSSLASSVGPSQRRLLIPIFSSEELPGIENNGHFATALVRLDVTIRGEMLKLSHLAFMCLGRLLQRAVSIGLSTQRIALKWRQQTSISIGVRRRLDRERTNRLYQVSFYRLAWLTYRNFSSRLQEYSNSCNGEIETLKTDKEEVEKQNGTLRESLEEIELKNRNLISQRKKLETRCEELDDQLANLKRRNEHQEQSFKSEINRLVNEKDTLLHELEEVKQDCRRKENQYEASLDHLSKVQQSIQEWKEKYKELNASRDKLARDNASLRESQQELRISHEETIGRAVKFCGWLREAFLGYREKMSRQLTLRDCINRWKQYKTTHRLMIQNQSIQDNLREIQRRCSESDRRSTDSIVRRQAAELSTTLLKRLHEWQVTILRSLKFENANTKNRWDQKELWRSCLTSLSPELMKIVWSHISMTSKQEMYELIGSDVKVFGIGGLLSSLCEETRSCYLGSCTAAMSRSSSAMPISANDDAGETVPLWMPIDMIAEQMRLYRDSLRQVSETNCKLSPIFSSGGSESRRLIAVLPFRLAKSDVDGEADEIVVLLGVMFPLQPVVNDNQTYLFEDRMRLEHSFLQNYVITYLDRILNDYVCQYAELHERRLADEATKSNLQQRNNNLEQSLSNSEQTLRRKNESLILSLDGIYYSSRKCMTACKDVIDSSSEKFSTKTTSWCSHLKSRSNSLCKSWLNAVLNKSQFSLKTFEELIESKHLVGLCVEFVPVEDEGLSNFGKTFPRWAQDAVRKSMNRNHVVAMKSDWSGSFDSALSSVDDFSSIISQRDGDDDSNVAMAVPVVSGAHGENKKLLGSVVLFPTESLVSANLEFVNFVITSLWPGLIILSDGLVNCYDHAVSVSTATEDLHRQNLRNDSKLKKLEDEKTGLNDRIRRTEQTMNQMAEEKNGLTCQVQHMSEKIEEYEKTVSYLENRTDCQREMLVDLLETADEIFDNTEMKVEQWDLNESAVVKYGSQLSQSLSRSMCFLASRAQGAKLQANEGFVVGLDSGARVSTTVHKLATEFFGELLESFCDPRCIQPAVNFSRKEGVVSVIQRSASNQSSSVPGYWLCGTCEDIKNRIQNNELSIKGPAIIILPFDINRQRHFSILCIDRGIDLVGWLGQCCIRFLELGVKQYHNFQSRIKYFVNVSDENEKLRSQISNLEYGLSSSTANLRKFLEAVHRLKDQLRSTGKVERKRLYGLVHDHPESGIEQQLDSFCAELHYSLTKSSSIPIAYKPPHEGLLYSFHCQQLEIFDSRLAKTLQDDPNLSTSLNSVSVAPLYFQTSSDLSTGYFEEIASSTISALHSHSCQVVKIRDRNISYSLQPANDEVVLLAVPTPWQIPDSNAYAGCLLYATVEGDRTDELLLKFWTPILAKIAEEISSELHYFAEQRANLRVLDATSQLTIKQLQDEIKRVSDFNASLRSQLAELNEQLQTIEEENASTQSELRSAKSEVDTLTGELNKEKQKNQEETDSLIQENKRLQERTKELEHEVNEGMSQLENAKNRIKILEEQLQNKDGEIAGLNKLVDDINLELETERDRRKELDKGQEHLSRLYDQATGEAAELRGQTSYQEGLLKDQSDRLKEVSAKLDAAESEREQLEKQLTHFEEEKANIESSLRKREREYDVLHKQHDLLYRWYEDSTTNIDKYREEVAKIKATSELDKDALEEKEWNYKQASERERNLQHALETLQEEKDTTEDNMEYYKQKLDALTNTFSEKVNYLEELQGGYNDLHESHEDLLCRCQTLEQQVAALEEKISEYERVSTQNKKSRRAAEEQTELLLKSVTTIRSLSRNLILADASCLSSVCSSLHESEDILCRVFRKLLDGKLSTLDNEGLINCLGSYQCRSCNLWTLQSDEKSEVTPSPIDSLLVSGKRSEHSYKDSAYVKQCYDTNRAVCEERRDSSLLFVPLTRKPHEKTVSVAVLQVTLTHIDGVSSRDPQLRTGPPDKLIRAIIRWTEFLLPWVNVLLPLLRSLELPHGAIATSRNPTNLLRDETVASQVDKGDTSIQQVYALQRAESTINSLRKQLDRKGEDIERAVSDNSRYWRVENQRRLQRLLTLLAKKEQDVRKECNAHLLRCVFASMKIRRCEKELSVEKEKAENAVTTLREELDELSERHQNLVHDTEERIQSYDNQLRLLEEKRRNESASLRDTVEELREKLRNEQKSAADLDKLRCQAVMSNNKRKSKIDLVQNWLHRLNKQVRQFRRYQERIRSSVSKDLDDLCKGFEKNLSLLSSTVRNQMQAVSVREELVKQQDRMTENHQTLLTRVDDSIKLTIDHIIEKSYELAQSPDHHNNYGFESTVYDQMLSSLSVRLVDVFGALSLKVFAGERKSPTSIDFADTARDLLTPSKLSGSFGTKTRQRRDHDGMSNVKNIVLVAQANSSSEDDEAFGKVSEGRYELESSFVGYPPSANTRTRKVVQNAILHWQQLQLDHYCKSLPPVLYDEPSGILIEHEGDSRGYHADSVLIPITRTKESSSENSEALVAVVILQSEGLSLTGNTLLALSIAIKRCMHILDFSFPLGKLVKAITTVDESHHETEAQLSSQVNQLETLLREKSSQTDAMRSKTKELIEEAYRKADDIQSNYEEQHSVICSLIGEVCWRSHRVSDVLFRVEDTGYDENAAPGAVEKVEAPKLPKIPRLVLYGSKRHAGMFEDDQVTDIVREAWADLLQATCKYFEKLTLRWDVASRIQLFGWKYKDAGSGSKLSALANLSAAEKRPIVVGDVSLDSLSDPKKDLTSSGALMIVPIVDPSAGSTIGVIELAHSDSSTFSSVNSKLFLALSRFLGHSIVFAIYRSYSLRLQAYSNYVGTELSCYLEPSTTLDR